MKPYPPQPDWLRNMTNGLEKGYLHQVVVDGKRFAIVRMPEHRYLSGQDSKYGKTEYCLVDKQGNPERGIGLLHCSHRLESGGRASALLQHGKGWSRPPMRKIRSLWKPVSRKHHEQKACIEGGRHHRACRDGADSGD